MISRLYGGAGGTERAHATTRRGAPCDFRASARQFARARPISVQASQATAT